MRAKSAIATEATASTNPPADFDRDLAARLIGAALERSKTCPVLGGPTGQGRARVTFAADGSATLVEVEAPFHDTEVGRCIERTLERVSLPAFSGSAVTVSKKFEVPPQELSKH